jgi:Peptidase family S41/N-terminal domain of Peptidase_S41 in eukaryotic IRBP
MRAITLAAACVAFTLAIPGWAQTPPVAPAEQPLNQAEKSAVVEKAGELLTANYIFPDRAADAKAKIDAALAAGDYDSITASKAFAERLTSDLQSVTHDKHVRVFPPPAPRPPAGATVAAAPAPQRVYAGFSRVDRLKGNIGYIKLLNFPGSTGPFGQTANQAITDLAGTNALIIDMRDNGGGSPDGVAYLCSFFFDPKTPVHINGFVNRKSGTNEFSTEEFYTRPVPISYLGKPVYLLTSKRTFSGGEEFLYDLQTQKRARLIGEVTGGGANPGGIRPLPSRFAIFIPGGRAVNPITKTNWEGTGVTPDLAVDETLAFQAAMREIVASNPAKYAALKAEVASQSAEDGFVEASLLKFRDQPQPGGEAAVRSLFSGMASGNPDYTQMSDEVAKGIKARLDLFHADMSKAGEAKSVKFTGVGSAGLDNYELTTATSTVRFAVYLGADGKIVETNFGPPQPLPSQP